MVVLRVNNLSSPGLFRDVNFEIRAGEIVGFAGLVGSGRSEIARAIFGLDRNATGEVELNGKRLPLGSTTASMAAGIGLVPEDRKRQGLVLELPIRANVSLAILDPCAGPLACSSAGEKKKSPATTLASCGSRPPRWKPRRVR